MPNIFLSFLATTFFWEKCPSSILWWASAKVIHLSNLSFCTNSFLSIMMFNMGFSLLYFPFPCCQHSHHWPCFYHSFCFWTFCFSIGFCGVCGIALQMFNSVIIWFVSWLLCSYQFLSPFEQYQGFGCPIGICFFHFFLFTWHIGLGCFLYHRIHWNNRKMTHLFKSNIINFQKWKMKIKIMDS